MLVRELKILRDAEKNQNSAITEMFEMTESCS
jgi:hypothetical protein